MQTTQPNIQNRRLPPDDVRTVAPALGAYTQERLYGDVWKRSGPQIVRNLRLDLRTGPLGRRG